MKKVNKIAKKHFMKVLDQAETGPINIHLKLQEVYELAEAHVKTCGSGGVKGEFIADCYKVKWDLLKDGRIKFVPKKLQRLTFGQAAEYINARLDRKWMKPAIALRHLIVREKINISLHGRRNGEETFTYKELDRFINDRNNSSPRGRFAADLSQYKEHFGYKSDRYIAKLANCSASTVARYRKRHGIPSYSDAAQARIEAIRDRLGKEPATKLAKEIRVNRMTISKFMKDQKIPAYDPRLKIGGLGKG